VTVPWNRMLMPRAVSWSPTCEARRVNRGYNVGV
jgi:hypothetical protein